MTHGRTSAITHWRKRNNGRATLFIAPRVDRIKYLWPGFSRRDACAVLPGANRCLIPPLRSTQPASKVNASRSWLLAPLACRIGPAPAVRRGDDALAGPRYADRPRRPPDPGRQVVFGHGPSLGQFLGGAGFASSPALTGADGIKPLRYSVRRTLECSPDGWRPVRAFFT
jgi:hypothetical protein